MLRQINKTSHIIIRAVEIIYLLLYAVYILQTNTILIQTFQTIVIHCADSIMIVIIRVVKIFYTLFYNAYILQTRVTLDETFKTNYRIHRLLLFILFLILKARTIQIVIYVLYDVNLFLTLHLICVIFMCIHNLVNNAIIFLFLSIRLTRLIEKIFLRALNFYKR